MKLFKKIFKIFEILASNKIIKWIIVPFILLLLWFFLSLVYSSQKSFSVLQYPQNKNENNNFSGKKLLKDQKLIGKFKASENNLGIVSIRFGNVPRVDYEKEDIIIFRIKEETQTPWLYENKYRSGQFISNEYFPFGFKQIKNSKDKTYDFEILSLNGNIENAPETKDESPIYITKYKFSISDIFKNKKTIEDFMIKKIITFLTDYDKLISSSVFLLPLIFYLTWTIIIPKMDADNYASVPLNDRKKIAKRDYGKKLFTILVFTLLFTDIIYSEDLIIGFMLGILGLWVGVIFLNKYKSSVTFTVVFLVIVLSVLSIYFHLHISVDKSSTFAYFLMIIGFTQCVYEYKFKKDKKKLLQN